MPSFCPWDSPMSAKAAQRLPLGNSLTLPGMPWATPQLPMGHWPPLGRTWALIRPSLDLPSAISRMPCWAALMPQEGRSWAATLLCMGPGQPLWCPLSAPGLARLSLGCPRHSLVHPQASPGQPRKPRGGHRAAHQRTWGCLGAAQGMLEAAPGRPGGGRMEA